MNYILLSKFLSLSISVYRLLQCWRDDSEHITAGTAELFDTSPVLPLPDSVKDVAHLPEDHLQAAEGRRDAEPGRRAGDGVSTEPGLHGNENQQTHNLQRNYQHLSASFQDI